MSQSSALYDDVILDHIKNARNYRAIENPDRQAEGVNPLCGDSFTVYVNLDGEIVREAAFQCSCCGISMASASVMTEAVRGKSVERVRALYQHFMRLLNDEEAPQTADDMGELAVLGGGTRLPFTPQLRSAGLAYAGRGSGRTHTDYY